MKSLLFVISLLGIILLDSCASTRPINLGVVEQKLVPCPNSPNCVSTQSKSEKAKIAPLTYEGEMSQIMQKLVKTVKNVPRTKIITQTDSYLYVEFATSLMKFIDDVEFYIDDANKVIHFRSASRIGYSDLGTNRRRMENFRALFNEGD